MHRPSLFRIRRGWKIILLVTVVTAASFTLGVLANQVVVQQVQSLAGNHVLVPAPELQVLSTLWVINGTASLVTGVNLNVTTVSPTPLQLKLYQIFVQISCLPPAPAPPVEFTCSTGQTQVTLPTFLNGTMIVSVSLNPTIDPELSEVHDISFIVTGTLIGPLSTGLVGSGSTGPGGLTLTMAAFLLTTGTATGASTLAGGASGPVIQVVPPSGTNNFWCISVARTDAPGNTVNWYIRDIGNGVTSFDQISFVTGLSGTVNCTLIPTPLGVFLTLTSGNFRQI